jgi:molecular chaperone GrpE
LFSFFKNREKQKDMNENNDQITQEDLDELLQEAQAEASNDAPTEGTPATEVPSSEAQLAELKDKYLRLMAEFENFKRRNVKERMDMIRSASQDTLSALLPILDDFDRAQQNETLSEGVMMVYNKFYNNLAQKGLKPMESDGLDFNAEFHEAITEVPMGEAMKGKIIATTEKGYFLNDKIIRFAKVVVGA